MKNEDLSKFFLLLIVIYFLRTGYHLSTVFELAKTGAISMLPFLAYVIGNVFLLIGAFRYLFMKKGNGKLFVISAIALGFSFPSFLDLPNYSSLLELLVMSPATLTVFGILFGVMGWWLSRGYIKSNQPLSKVTNNAP